MTIDYRTRNIVIAAALAAAAVLLTVLYVSSARKHDKTQAQSVTVYVSTNSYPLGTAGTKVADHVKPTSIPRSAMTTDAVTNLQQIRNLYTTEPIYSGEQLTLKRFAPPAEQGIRSKLSGTQRAMQISGDTNQLLAGTLVPGDRVDVIANLKDPKNNENVVSVDHPARAAGSADRQGPGRRQDQPQHDRRPRGDPRGHGRAGPATASSRPGTPFKATGRSSSARSRSRRTAPARSPRTRPS